MKKSLGLKRPNQPLLSTQKFKKPSLTSIPSNNFLSEEIVNDDDDEDEDVC
jgi:hypothetical protein